MAILSMIYCVFGLLAVGTFNYGKDFLKREPVGVPGVRPPPKMDTMPGWELGIDQDTKNTYHEEITRLDEQKVRFDQEKIKKMEELMTLYAVSVSVNFLVSLSLLLGVKMEKKWLLLPWILWTALCLVISQAVVLYTPERTRSTIPDIFSTAIMVYCMLCVVSYYQTLSNPNGGGASTGGSGQSSSPPVVAFPVPNSSPSSQCASFPNCNLGSTGAIGALGGSARMNDLTVALPPAPSPPPAYTLDSPPMYDPPPAYPGFEISSEKLSSVGYEVDTALTEPSTHPNTNAAEVTESASASTTASTNTEAETDLVHPMGQDQPHGQQAGDPPCGGLV